MSVINLYNDNCIEAMKSIGDNTIDLIITDPPYNLGNFMKDRDTNLKKMRDNFFGDAGWDNMDFSEWKKLKKGEEIELKIDFNGFAEINNKD